MPRHLALLTLLLTVGACTPTTTEDDGDTDGGRVDAAEAYADCPSGS